MSCQELNLRAKEIALLSMEYSAKRVRVKEWKLALSEDNHRS